MMIFIKNCLNLNANYLRMFKMFVKFKNFLTLNLIFYSLLLNLFINITSVPIKNINFKNLHYVINLINLLIIYLMFFIIFIRLNFIIKLSKILYDS